MAGVVKHLSQALEGLEDLQFAPVGFPKDFLRGTFLGSLGQWQSLHEILVMRYERCKAMGRFLYEANGAIGTTRSMATALCLSKRFLQARAEAAFLIFMMVQPEAPGAFHVSTEMLRNGTGLSLVRLARFEDLKLDWMVLGVAKCGTTSLQFNLGIHPEATLKSTHSNTFSHTLLYSSSRFLPVHELQREFVSEMPSGLLGHPDWYKGNRSIGDTHGRQRSRRVGCSLVADLTPAYEDGTGNILSSLADPDAMPERFLYPFLLSTVLKAKPHLKMLYAVRDPLECFLSWNAWKLIVPPWCGHLQNFSSLCWNSVGHCRMSQAINLLCSEVTRCSRQNLALLTTQQTNDPKALAQAARYLGLNPSFYEAEGLLSALNTGKRGRHSKQSLCQSDLMSIRRQLKKIFHDEYGHLARLLKAFQLVDGSAQSMLAARDWSCDGKIDGL